MLLIILAVMNGNFASGKTSIVSSAIGPSTNTQNGPKQYTARIEE